MGKTFSNKMSFAYIDGGRKAKAAKQRKQDQKDKKHNKK